MSVAPVPKLETYADSNALARHLADWLLEAVNGTEGRFAISLSGGSTPRTLYQLLAKPEYREAFPWPRVHWFWGDERFVPRDDPQSNYRMVWEALLAHVPVPAANIHRIPTEGVQPAEAALLYERELQSFYGADQLDPARPLFDVTFLGLGSDGHTASLFPDTPALAERDHWVAVVGRGEVGPRITLTYPALESSQRVAFLIVGEDKREIFKRLRNNDQNLPAAHLRPSGEICFFADSAARGVD